MLKPINGETKLLGVLGYPASHSRSPEIHQYWHEKYQINARYLAFSVASENLEQAIKGARALGVRGLNITVPHKEACLQYADEIDATAQKIGAANTLIFDASGKIKATNTDAYGVIENLHQAVGNITPYLEKVVVLGAGGAARAAIAGLQEAGAKHIIIANRTKEKSETLARQMGGNISIKNWQEKETVLADATLLINTTSLGMQGKSALEISLTNLPKTACVYDIIYTPLMTDLLQQAQARGNFVVTGIGMLLYQAQKAFEYWHGVLPEIDATLKSQLSKPSRSETV